MQSSPSSVCSPTLCKYAYERFRLCQSAILEAEISQKITPIYISFSMVVVVFRRVINLAFVGKALGSCVNMTALVFENTVWSKPRGLLGDGDVAP